MPRVVVKVTHGPRWDHTSGRWQVNGEKVVIEHDDHDEFVRLCAVHEVHCRELVEGEWPMQNPPKASFFDKVKAKAAPLIAKPALKPKKAEGFVCPDCKRSFKSERGLQVHFGHSGHGGDKD